MALPRLDSGEGAKEGLGLDRARGRDKGAVLPLTEAGDTRAWAGLGGLVLRTKMGWMCGFVPMPIPMLVLVPMLVPVPVPVLVPVSMPESVLVWAWVLEGGRGTLWRFSGAGRGGRAGTEKGSGSGAETGAGAGAGPPAPSGARAGAGTGAGTGTGIGTGTELPEDCRACWRARGTWRMAPPADPSTSMVKRRMRGSGGRRMSGAAIGAGIGAGQCCSWPGRWWSCREKQRRDETSDGGTGLDRNRAMQRRAADQARQEPIGKPAGSPGHATWRSPPRAARPPGSASTPSAQTARIQPCRASAHPARPAGGAARDRASDRQGFAT